MKVERMILIAFFGNYLVNNVVAALASLVPATPGSTSIFTAQYLTFILLGAIMIGIMSWWYLMRMSRAGALVQGVIFGVVGFVVAIATAFVTGVAGVLLQTGSFSQVAAVLPNFGPYIMNKTTLILLGLWVIPALLIGWFMQSRMHSPAPSMPRPMI
jgi:hypothetical protein